MNAHGSQPYTCRDICRKKSRTLWVQCPSFCAVPWCPSVISAHISSMCTYVCSPWDQKASITCAASASRTISYTELISVAIFVLQDRLTPRLISPIGSTGISNQYNDLWSVDGHVHLGSVETWRETRREMDQWMKNLKESERNVQQELVIVFSPLDLSLGYCLSLD